MERNKLSWQQKLEVAFLMLFEVLVFLSTYVFFRANGWIGSGTSEMLFLVFIVSAMDLVIEDFWRQWVIVKPRVSGMKEDDVYARR